MRLILGAVVAVALCVPRVASAQIEDPDKAAALAAVDVAIKNIEDATTKVAALESFLDDLTLLPPTAWDALNATIQADANIAADDKFDANLICTSMDTLVADTRAAVNEMKQEIKDALAIAGQGTTLFKAGNYVAAKAKYDSAATMGGQVASRAFMATSEVACQNCTSLDDLDRIVRSAANPVLIP